MQALQPGNYANLNSIKTTQLIIERHGVRGLFRGVSAVAAGAGNSTSYPISSYYIIFYTDPS